MQVKLKTKIMLKHKDVDIISPCLNAVTYFIGYLSTVCCMSTHNPSFSFLFLAMGMRGSALTLTVKEQPLITDV